MVGCYLYAGADLAFLNYINVFYFSNYNTNVSNGMQVLQSTQDYCSSLVQPLMTSSNYEYLISAELRQSWANYTISTAIANYNQSNIETDEVLGSMYSAAQAEGWCRAANTLYAAVQPNNASEFVQPSQLLGSVALSRINKVQSYGSSIYLNTARLAYNQGNYPLAILDADYDYVLSGISAGTNNMNNSDIISAASSLLANNATYGVWATEFAKEALFYINESKITANATLAHTYALQAYSSADLAQHLGSDMRLIHANLVQASGAQSTNQNLGPIQDSISRLNNMFILLLVLIIFIALLTAFNTVLIVGLLKTVRGDTSRTGKGRRKSR